MPAWTSAGGSTPQRCQKRVWSQQVAAPDSVGVSGGVLTPGAPDARGTVRVTLRETGREWCFLWGWRLVLGDGLDPQDQCHLLSIGGLVRLS